MNVTFDLARREDLPAIVALLADDVLGSKRETPDLAPYERAFAEIEADPRELLLVGRSEERVVATLQLSLLSGLSRGATRRAQIEAVRVHADLRGTGVGRRLIEHALDLARERGCGLAQLTTDHQRPEALRFYEGLGFQATHHGMKRPL